MLEKPSADLVRTIRSANLAELAKEVAEVSLDALLESDGLARDLPVVGALVGLWNVGTEVRNRLLAEKIVRFLEQLSSLEQEERDTMIQKLDQDAGFRNRVGERLLEILDRVTVDKQPEMIGKVFAAFARGEVSELELKRLVVAIERVPPHELGEARVFYELPEDALQQKQATDPMLLLALQAAGLVENRGGWGGGVFNSTPLLEKFMKLELDR